MKTKTMNSVKLISKVMLVIAFFSILSCNGNEREQITESKPTVPEVNIHTDAFMGNVEAIHQHIKAGTDLNAKDQYGSTPLTIAATFGKTDVAKALIEGGADLEVTNNEGSTALHIAAFFCRTDIVKALLENGADKSLKNGNGVTALETVAGSFEQVRGIYEYINKELGPLGLRLDYDRLEKTRPEIAKLLQ